MLQHPVTIARRARLLPRLVAGAFAVVLAALLSTQSGAQDKPAGTSADQKPVLGLLWSEKVPGTLIVREVAKGTPAANADIRPGDIIVSVNGTPVANSGEAERMLGTLRGGEKAELVVARGRKEHKVTITVPQAGATDTKVGFLGATLRLDGRKRLVVGELTPASPAADAGIKPGDIILSVEGQVADSIDSLVDQATKIVSAKKPGDQLVVMVDRGGEKKEIAIVLSEGAAVRPPQEGGRGVPEGPMNTMVLGVVVDDTASKQVKVTQVIEKGPAARAGIAPGDVIVGINGQKINSFAQLASAVNGFKPGQKAKVDVLRADKALLLITVAARNESAVPDVSLDPKSNPTGAQVPVAAGAMSEEVMVLRQRVDQLEATVQQLSAEVAALKAGNR